MSPIDLTGKTAVITGASGGLGSATSLKFLELGAHVIMGVRARKSLESLFESVSPGARARATIIECNLDNYSDVNAFVKNVYNVSKTVDIVINNAGVLKESLIGMITKQELDETMAINLAGVIFSMQGFARIMKRSKKGSIINISSVVGVKGAAGQLVYAASKAGVIGATLAASKELAPDGIRVNAIAPGLIDTKMTQAFSSDRRDRLREQVGMRRIGRPEEVANVAMFLASDLSTYVTGQVIGVDGGLII